MLNLRQYMNQARLRASEIVLKADLIEIEKYLQLDICVKRKIF